jgi:hypothetical protein
MLREGGRIRGPKTIITGVMVAVVMGNRGIDGVARRTKMVEEREADSKLREKSTQMTAQTSAPTKAATIIIFVHKVRRRLGPMVNATLSSRRVGH